MIEHTDIFWLNVAFFIPKTNARRTRISRIIKDLDAPHPTGRHLFAERFQSEADHLEVTAHVDESTFADGEVCYYIQLHFHELTDDDLKASAEVSAQKSAAYLFDNLSKLLRKGQQLLVFFDAEWITGAVRSPSAVIAPPIAVGGRSLPVRGIEYGLDKDVEGVDTFRWTTEDAGLKLNLSYSVEMALNGLDRLLPQERKRVEGYVLEVFPS